MAEEILQEEVSISTPPQEAQAQTEAPQEMPQEMPQDDFDTTKDIEQLQGLEKEVQDIEASLENNFAEYITQLIDNDPTFEDLFYSDRKTFFKKVIQEQNEFVKAQIQPKLAKAEELNSQIQDKQELSRIDLIKRQFQAAHPNVDVKELIMFFANELPPKIQQEIKAQPIEQFFELVYAIYQQMTNPQNAQQEAQEAALPPQAQGVAVGSDNASSNASQLPLDRM